MSLAAFLLADGRFPAGGHAHSGGVEAAVRDGRVHDVASLDGFVRGRLATAGRTDAALAVATWARLDPLDGADPRMVVVVVDAEADARLAPPSLRVASRRLGTQLLRAARVCWDDDLLVVVSEAVPAGLHQACALGAVGRVAGLDAPEVARLALHHCASVPAQAGVRLLGLDPFAVAALLAGVTTDAEVSVRDAVASARAPLAELPACTGPVVDVAAVEHTSWDDRLFVT